MVQVVCLDGIAPFQIDDGDTLANACLVLTRVADHVDELGSREERVIREAAPSRQHEFSSGRRAAHLALRHFGLDDATIDRVNRMPRWPKGIVGSISHSTSLAVAIAGSASNYTGLGLDVIPLLAVSEKVGNRVLLDSEQEWIVQMGSGEWRTALYSAKESVYKAVNPVVGEFLAFDDVSLQVAPDSLEFRAMTTRDRESTRVVDSGLGYFHRIEGHWLTIFEVPQNCSV